MSGSPSDDARRVPSRLSPWLLLTGSIGVVFAVWVATAPPPPEVTLVDLPARYSRIVVEGDGAAEPAPVEPVAAAPRRASGASEEGKGEQVLHKSKLLLKLIGTGGESSARPADAWSDEDRGLGDIDAALEHAGGVTTDAASAGPRGGLGGDGEAVDIGDLAGPGGGTVAGGELHGPRVEIRGSVRVGAGRIVPKGAEGIDMPPVDVAAQPHAIAARVERRPVFEGEPFVETDRDPLSTFSIDVDTASWTRSVAQLARGASPAAGQVRVEEFVNAFHYDYEAPSDGRAFAVHALAAPSPWAEGQHLLRIGLQAEEVSADDPPPVHLTFLVDTSGSMRDSDKLPLVRDALHRMVDRLRPEDSVAVVTYAGSSEVLLEPTSAAHPALIHGALDRLQARGGTAMADGVFTAYELASRGLEAPVRWAGIQLPFGGRGRDAVHRVVLVSDGDANIGPSDPSGILPAIREHAVRGVTLTTLGVGRSGYRDDMMEKLADEGDGAYFFLSNGREADRVLGRELTSTLHVVARDTKVQVAFDPDVVRRYRLIGYDNRRLLDRDFRDDAVDAGEVGSGHQVTALYEVELTDPSQPLGEVRLRYKPPGPDAPSQEVVAVMGPSTVDRLEEASPSMRAAVAVAGVARVLRREEGFGRERLPELEALARGTTVDPTRAEELWGLFRAMR